MRGARAPRIVLFAFVGNGCSRGSGEIARPLVARDLSILTEADLPPLETVFVLIVHVAAAIVVRPLVVQRAVSLCHEALPDRRADDRLNLRQIRGAYAPLGREGFVVEWAAHGNGCATGQQHRHTDGGDDDAMPRNAIVLHGLLLLS